MGFDWIAPTWGVVNMRRTLLFTVVAAIGLVIPLEMAFASTKVTWSTFKPPFRGTEIAGFAARSATDVWGVGLQPGGRCQYQTLTEHWDGSAWSVVSSPSNTRVNSVLDAVAVVPKTNEAWAVGTVGCPASQSATLVEHWNGSNWSIVPSPNGGPTGTAFSALHAVTAIASNNVWAVGLQIVTRNNVDTPIPLIEHWNGARWSVVPPPATARSGLQSISATSATDVWAVGAGLGGSGATLVLHFNGSTWTATNVPTLPNTYGALFGVEAVSSNDVWTVGEAYPNSGGNGTMLIDHWNGTTWKVSPTPPGPPNALSGLFAVDEVPGTGVWAVGTSVTDVNAQAVVLHWTGTAWTQETPPGSPSLFALAVLPNDSLFASYYGFIMLGKVS